MERILAMDELSPQQLTAAIFVVTRCPHELMPSHETVMMIDPPEDIPADIRAQCLGFVDYREPGISRVILIRDIGDRYRVVVGYADTVKGETLPERKQMMEARGDELGAIVFGEDAIPFDMERAIAMGLGVMFDGLFGVDVHVVTLGDED